MPQSYFEVLGLGLCRQLQFVKSLGKALDEFDLSTVHELRYGEKFAEQRLEPGAAG